MATWYRSASEDPEPVTLRHRWFWWPTDNLTIGSTIYHRHSPVNAPTMRHELIHVRQYRQHGMWWILLHPMQREAEAHDAETAEYPTWRIVEGSLT